MGSYVTQILRVQPPNKVGAFTICILLGTSWVLWEVVLEVRNFAYAFLIVVGVDV
jgi:hypothetical protein